MHITVASTVCGVSLPRWVCAWVRKSACVCVCACVYTLSVCIYLQLLAITDYFFCCLSLCLPKKLTAHILGLIFVKYSHAQSAWLQCKRVSKRDSNCADITLTHTIIPWREMDANLIRLIGSTAQHFRIMKGPRQLLWGSVIYCTIVW